MEENGVTNVFRVTWAADEEGEQKAARMIVMARRHIDKQIGALRGVNYIMSCITGLKSNRYTS